MHPNLPYFVVQWNPVNTVKDGPEKFGVFLYGKYPVVLAFFWDFCNKEVTVV